MTDLRSKETMLTFNVATDFKINPRMGFGQVAQSKRSAALGLHRYNECTPEMGCGLISLIIHSFNL